MIEYRKENSENYEVNRDTKDALTELMGEDIDSIGGTIFIRDPSMDKPVSKAAALIDDLTYKGSIPVLNYQHAYILRGAKRLFAVARYFMNEGIYETARGIVDTLRRNIDRHPSPVEYHIVDDPIRFKALTYYELEKNIDAMQGNWTCSTNQNVVQVSEEEQQVLDILKGDQPCIEETE